MTTAVEITMPVQFKMWADDSAAFSMHRVRRLQYLRESLPEMLDRLSRRPARIVIDSTPIHRTHSLFTLNSIGTAYCPYRVEGHDAFVAAVSQRGLSPA